jgi:hypothetical protein
MFCLVRSETAPHIVDRIELNAHNRSKACLKRLVAKLLDVVNAMVNVPGHLSGIHVPALQTLAESVKK